MQKERIIEMSFSRILENLPESKRILKLQALTTTELEIPYQQEKHGENLGKKKYCFGCVEFELFGCQASIKRYHAQS